MNQQPTKISPEYLEQNPLVALALTGFMLFAIAFLFAAVSTWIWLLIRARQGKPILVPEPWKPRAWGFVDILIAALLVLFWQLQSSLIGLNLGWGRQQAESQGISLPLATLSGAANIVAMMSICLWIIVRHRSSFEHLGFSAIRFTKHIGVGIIAGLACIPCVYALMAAVSIGFDNKYEHPLLEEIKRDGSMTAYLLAFTSAVLIAPLVEEFLFRVVIQGWLQSAPFGTLKSILLGYREEPKFAVVATAPPVVVPASHQNPYAPTTTIQATTAESSDETTFTPPIWPSVVTGILFGLAHLGYGLSFIPLMVLGTILGLLYRATHSIWPSLVVHFMLNGISMTTLGVALLMERASQ